MRTRAVLHLLAPMLGLLLLLRPPAAQSQPADAAEEAASDEDRGKQLATEAFQAYKADDYERALALFDEARKVYPTGQVLRMTGYSLFALKRWAEAIEILKESLATEYKPLEGKVREEVENTISRAKQHLGTVTITSEVEGATVSVDGKEPRALPAELQLSEGSHHLLVHAEGHTDDERKIDLRGGDRISIDMRPVQLDSPKPKPKPKPKPVAPPADTGWFPYQKEVGFGIGGLGLGVAATGIAVLVSGTSLRSATQENIDAHNAAYGTDCSLGDPDLCYYDTQVINQDGEQADDLQTTGLVLTIAGGLLLGTGIVFVVFAPWDDEEGASSEPETGTRVELGCGPFGLAGLGCTGHF